ncbi:MAG: SIS domain-containing protein [Candidatus Omnitrophica bacterium]|nr:SIS domain-containing protein [Candidatus Omnitrophota bacterium]
MEDKILKEITDAVKGIEEKEYKLLTSLIQKAKRVFVAGKGRSGFIGRCFAIRLRHLGIECYVAEETICPPIKKGDLLVAISSSGSKKTILGLIEKAKKSGAKVLAITSEKESPLKELSDYTILIDAEKSIQFGGSLFEQVSLIFLDIFVEKFRKYKGISHRDMAKRHTNLE